MGSRHMVGGTLIPRSKTASDVTAAPATDLVMTLWALEPEEALKLAQPMRLTFGSPHRADGANRV